MQLFKLRLLYVLTALSLMGCHRAESVDSTFGPVIGCILSSCSTTELQQRVKSSTDANAAIPTGRTALMYAAGSGVTFSERVLRRSGKPIPSTPRAEYVRILLASGASVDAVDGEGGTALGAAIYNGNPEVVRLLLAAKSDPQKPSGSELPLQLAALHCDKEIAAMLIAAGAQVEAGDPLPPHKTAAEVAKENDCSDVVPTP